MYNAPQPKPEDLPSIPKLIRSAIMAAIGAVVLLFTVYLPAEYAIDPTGIGRVIGLTEMGEIKQELEAEAERDRELHGSNQSSGLMESLHGLVFGKAIAQEAWRDTVTLTLAPGASAEIKLVMEPGMVARYDWAASGGRINFDLHAHGGGQSIDYDKGRGVTSGNGVIEAPFTGEHGWFWRNRDRNDVTITLRLGGDYSELKQIQ